MSLMILGGVSPPEVSPVISLSHSSPCVRSEVLEGLIAEYKACATPDYGSWDGSAATSSSLVSGGAGGGDDGEAGGFGA